MRRLVWPVRAAVLLVIVSACLGAAAGRFDQKLPADKQAIHVLNRLTFGARPGDVEQVRRMGVEKWIDQQLHPEQISENPNLETKLQPLSTLQLATWQIVEKYPTPKYAEFQFNPAWHDRKEKVILGHMLPPGRGEQDGLDVLDILAHHPSTAKFISKKLAQRFVADNPPQQLVDRMAATFTKTDGDLRAVLQTMFNSAEFLSEGAWQAKLKSPLEAVVGAARALNAEVTDTFGLAQRIADLGEPLYGKVEPTGYPNTGEIWTNTASLLGRINFCNRFSRRRGFRGKG